MSESHTERFSGRVDAYARHRPSFPRAIVAFLREHRALADGATVADVGAGTGMLAEVFLDAGHRVLAVEPNREMLTACRQLATRYAALQVVEGSAEHTALAENSIDLVTVGRAMHWFDWKQAHREFRRILRPEGWVLIATNGHRDSGALVSEQLTDLLRRHRMDSCEADVRRDFDQRLRGFLDPATWHRTRLDHSMTVTFETLLGYAQSLSAIPHPGQTGYEAMAAALQSIFHAHQSEGQLTTPLVSQLFLGRLRADFTDAAE